MFTDALWISIPRDIGEICPEFYKEITLAKPLKEARLKITAIGVYEAYINQKRVGNFILAPGCTVYQKRLQVQEYDVRELLEEKNELSISVGTGWYRGKISANSKDVNEEPCGLIAELQLSYEDGSQETIFTDGSWLVRKSKILFSDIYDGELYDATAEKTELGAAKVLEGFKKDTLIAQQGEFVCEHECIKPAACFVTPKGERVIDFGQNLTGYVQISITAKTGDRIALSHAEVLDADGNFYTENYRDAKAKLEYICRDGRQTYKPHFTFFGFRYIRLDAYPGEVDMNDFTAIAVYSDMKRTGYIECSNSKINQLFSNTLWSQRDNFLDIPTDCPQRNERMGWLGDAQVFAKTACYNFDVKKFFEKWMQDLCAEQREDGSVPDTVPNFWKISRASTAWGDAMTIIPWQLYVAYGDFKVLADNFDAMKKWVDYITNDTLDAFLWTHDTANEDELWKKHYGDWLGLDAPEGSYRGSTEDDFIASAFYAYSTSLLIKAGQVLGKDMSQYELLYDNIVNTFKKHFPSPRTQTEHVLVLYFGLTDDMEGTAAALAQMIRDNGNKLKTGFVGTPYLLHALSGSGHAEVAYDLLLQEEYPSWLYEVNKGATTIWEHWDGIKDDGSFWSSDMNSYNHYAYGSVIDWVYTVAAGIQAVEDAPGFERVQIAPVPDKRLQWLRAELDTANGRIRSFWKITGEQVRYEIETPAPAIIIIGGQKHQVEAGSYIFYSTAEA